MSSTVALYILGLVEMIYLTSLIGKIMAVVC